MSGAQTCLQARIAKAFSKIVIVPGWVTYSLSRSTVQLLTKTRCKTPHRNGCVNIRNCNWYGWLADELMDMKDGKSYTEVVMCLFALCLNEVVPWVLANVRFYCIRHAKICLTLSTRRGKSGWHTWRKTCTSTRTHWPLVTPLDLKRSWGVRCFVFDDSEMCSSEVFHWTTYFNVDMLRRKR